MLSQNIEQAFLNTVIAFKLMQYCYSLQSFFKNEFKKDNCYVIPFSHILYVKRYVFPIIRDSCSYVCPHDQQCDGRKFLDFIEELYQFQLYAVLEKKCFFKDFIFDNFRLKRDERIEVEKVNGWDFHPNLTKDLSHLTYSQRCHYLN